MKKLFIILLAINITSVVLNAKSNFFGTIIPLQMQSKDFPDYSGTSRPINRLPQRNHKQIIIDNNILYFDESLSSSIISIYREDDSEEVFTENITDGESSIVLPSLCSGRYIVKFETQYYIYFGEFSL